eukprot:350412-Chlamydomonas_euryale.AAC.2
MQTHLQPRCLALVAISTGWGAVLGAAGRADALGVGAGNAKEHGQSRVVLVLESGAVPARGGLQPEAVPNGKGSSN